MDSAAVFERYYNLSLRFLSYRPRSGKEVKDYLKNKKLPDELISKILEKLTEYKFINDVDFAKFWMEQRTRFKQKPLWIIKSELQQKGISKEIIDEVLLDFDDNKSLDLNSAKKLALKKLDFYRNLPPQKRREKVMNFLIRRGFNYDVVKKVLK